VKPVDSVSRTGVPLRISEPWARPDRTRAPAILFFPGLSAAKEVQDTEAQSLAEHGIAAVVVDPPHHGARRTALLDEMAGAGEEHRHRLLLRIVREAIAEVPALVDELVARRHPAVAIGGISMGAFIALGAALEEPRLAAVVSILGSPDWTPKSGRVPDDVRGAVAADPLRRADLFAPRPVLLVNAGRDENVPPEPARRLNAVLREHPHYAARPADLVHHEYPDSGHFVREEDWRDLWARTLAFLGRDWGVQPSQSCSR
jgi:dienelactone hydrolase